VRVVRGTVLEGGTLIPSSASSLFIPGGQRSLEELTAKLEELERGRDLLREEKEAALDAVDNAQVAYAERIAESQSRIDTLNKDVEVHREQMELAQTMLEEKEQLASELRQQLEDAVREEEMRVAQLQEDLAAKCREASNANMELDERDKDVEILEEKLEKVRREFVEHRAEVEAAAAEAAAAAYSRADDEEENDGHEETHTDAAAASTSNAEAAANAAHAAQMAERMAELAEKESQIERLERELGTGRRQLDATRVELEEKDKHSERLRAELERSKAQKGSRVEELEVQLDEKNRSAESLRKQLDDERQSLEVAADKLKTLEEDLANAVESAKSAEEDRDSAHREKEEHEKAGQLAVHEQEKLKSQVELLQKANEKSVSEVEALRAEADKEKKSSLQSAATLAATNAARQAEMEMKIEKMQKEIEFKKREIDAIKSELKDKDQTAKRLKNDLSEAKEDLINYKEKIESEKEQIEAEKEAEALQRVADDDYYDADDIISCASNAEQSYSTAGGTSRGRGILGLFNRSANDCASEDSSVNWEVRAREKDSRIAYLEKSLADNALSISNLKNELVTASSKFKEDESQRRLLIQRLENENQAYSIKLEVLETEFEEIRKRKEAVAVAKSNNSYLSGSDDGSVASSVHSNHSGGSATTGCSTVMTTGGHSMGSMTGVSAVTGASRLTPLERDNRKLKKQKKVYETRIASLQTQLSEIQQIVPELMSKSKSQITKLEAVIETQRQESHEKEQKLEDEIKQLRGQNGQLQAATRSRLQSSDVDRQEEIDHLKMRLEAREATITKLEIMAKSGKSFRKKGGKLLRKKKAKTPGFNNDGDMSILSESSWGTEQQSVSYSVTNDTVFSAM